MAYCCSGSVRRGGVGGVGVSGRRAAGGGGGSRRTNRNCGSWSSRGGVSDLVKESSTCHGLIICSANNQVGSREGDRVTKSATTSDFKSLSLLNAGKIGTIDEEYKTCVARERSSRRPTTKTVPKRATQTKRKILRTRAIGEIL